jgi:hypothetical protein
LHLPQEQERTAEPATLLLQENGARNRVAQLDQVALDRELVRGARLTRRTAVDAQDQRPAKLRRQARSLLELEMVRIGLTPVGQFLGRLCVFESGQMKP